MQLSMRALFSPFLNYMDYEPFIIIIIIKKLKQLSTIMKAHENKRERLRRKCLIPRVFSALEIFGGW